MTEQIYALVIGAGQAGLCVSYYLKRYGIEHLVLEKSSIGESWRRRWDSFCLVTPNMLNALPDFPSGGEPDGFLSKAEVVRYIERFAQGFQPPIRTGVTATAVTPTGSAGMYEVETTSGSYRCHDVVIATNIFQHPRMPPLAANLSPAILQLHSDEYRAPWQLPDGPVLVIGSGQSGTQIADELQQAGRTVLLSVSRAGRLPRRYRGRDIMDWIRIFKGWERTVDQLDSPADRTAARPHVSGKAGGRTLNLRSFGRQGMQLLGKVSGAGDGKLFFADDVGDNLRKSDEFAQGLCGAIDFAIEKSGVEAWPRSDEETRLETWSPPDIIRELSLRDAGITTVIWATGYPFSFEWVKGLELDRYNYPVHTRGVTTMPGIYFASLPWLHKHKSSSLYGAAEDAEYVARHIAQRAGVKL